MRGAIIENGVVTNFILLPENFEGDSWGGKQLVITDIAAIGDSYLDGEFLKPVLPEPEIQIPQVVTMAQARKALLKAGHLSKVSEAINDLASPDKELAQISWEFETTVNRHSDLVNFLAPKLGLSNADLDNLFLLASTL